MKKILSIILTCIMALSMLACQQSTVKKTEPDISGETLANQTDPNPAAQEEIASPDAETEQPQPETENLPEQKIPESDETDPEQGNQASVPAEQTPTPPTHTHQYSSVTVSPTCGSGGYTEYTCSCGSHYTDSNMSALGHAWSDWKILQEATSSAEGYQQKTCTRCGETDTVAIPKIGTTDINMDIQEGTYKVVPIASLYPEDSPRLTEADIEEIVQDCIRELEKVPGIKINPTMYVDPNGDGGAWWCWFPYPFTMPKEEVRKDAIGQVLFDANDIVSHNNMNTSECFLEGYVGWMYSTDPFNPDGFNIVFLSGGMIRKYEWGTMIDYKHWDDGDFPFDDPRFAY